MAAADRLSALADDLLQRILSFAPAKEAAASAALSRRWRPLWRRTGALNLDSKPYPRQYSYGNRHDPYDDFFRHGMAALGCRRETALKRLTLYLGMDAYLVGGKYYSSHDGDPEFDARVTGLLVDPAAAALEELRIAAEPSYRNSYVAPLASLPCATTTLRVLELDSCDLEPSARLAFPLLTDLTLRNCTYVVGYLQVVLDAAPALIRLALVNVTNKPPKPPASEKDRYYTPKTFNLPLCLRCPTVTALVLETTVSGEELDDSRNIGIQLDMPSLCSFRYKGFPFKLSLTSPAPGLAQVHLDTNHSERGVYKCEPTARALGSFSSTRALKLHLKKIENIFSHNASSSYRYQGSTGNQDPDEEVTLPNFPNLKLLEIDAEFNYRDSNTALALAMLLHSCPAMSELRLRLNMTWDYDYDRKTEKQAAGGPFAQSVERFSRLGSMCAEHRDDVELGGVSELPAAFANNSAFSCLRTCLRKVTLQFKSKELNCFQVQLAKFLVENAMVLEEMHVEDGDQFWPDHLFDKLTRWRTDAFRRRNLSDTTGFQVFQLANPVVDPKVKVHY
ncbi:hypothetical protein VPH35_019165 [Triticum aestivum]|uniref:F-box/LRR-repeat protein 15/At3g58940/PEG3-like LRR domain-containing protein n=1 Tax=Triticum turgidum subsp. durum TaxID=4567 RepID=A0A9R1NK73_TRITD|nr:unnamed protein product [Triticum turgidum subsp. durum]